MTDTQLSDMSDTAREAVESLHTDVVDAIAGYRTMHEKAEPGFRRTVDHLIDLHEHHKAELEQWLARAGGNPDNNGSLMSNVHRTVVTVRSWVDTIDDGVIPAIVDGESRNLESYDEAVARIDHAGAREAVARQRDELAELVTHLRQRA